MSVEREPIAHATGHSQPERNRPLDGRTRRPFEPGSVETVKLLQRTAGNRAIASLFESAQGQIDRRPAKTLPIPRVRKTKRFRRAIEAGQTYERFLMPIRVSYHEDYETFVAKVAHRLRRTLVYRSDSGEYARSLVRASVDLRRIHTRMVESKLHFTGKPIGLSTIMYCRKSDISSRRWVDALDFDFARSLKEFSGETVEGRGLGAAARILQVADSVAKKDFDGERAARVQGYVNLAKQLGPDRFGDLWHYDHVKVRDLLWEDDPGSLVAADGSLDSSWRIYPFRRLLDYDDVSEVLASVVLAETDHACKFMTPHTEGRFSAKVTAEDRHWVRYMTHLRKLQSTSTHLYHIYNKLTKDTFVGFERW